METSVGVVVMMILTVDLVKLWRILLEAKEGKEMKMKMVTMMLVVLIKNKKLAVDHDAQVQGSYLI